MDVMIGEYDLFPSGAVWLRRADETPKAYGAFSSYRDAGAERSLRQACQDHFCMAEKPPPCRSNVPAKLRQIQSWSSMYRWVERVQAYDAHLEWMVRIENLDQAKEMYERHAAAGAIGVDVGERAILSINPLELTPGEAVAMLDAGTRIEQVAQYSLLASVAPEVSPSAVAASRAAADQFIRESIMSDPWAAVVAAEIARAIAAAEHGGRPQDGNCQYLRWPEPP